jgi:uncharacterized protein YcbX
VRVAALWRYPVKSLRGERLERANLLADGFEGDRLVRLEDERGLLTARRKQRLVGVAASVGGDGEARIEGEAWRSEAAARRIRALGGDGARLVATESGARFDAAPVLLVTDGALEAFGADLRRFRPNIVVENVPGLAEPEWVGRELAVGEAALAVRETCERCAVITIDPETTEVRPDVLRQVNDRFDGVMGVYCDVARPGTIAVGDQVVIS